MKIALPFAVAGLVMLSGAALGDDLDQRIAAPQLDPASVPAIALDKSTAGEIAHDLEEVIARDVELLGDLGNAGQIVALEGQVDQDTQ